MKKADIFSGNMNAVNFYTSKKTRVSDINDYEDKDKQSVIQSPIEEFPLKKLKTSKVTQHQDPLQGQSFRKNPEEQQKTFSQLVVRMNVQKFNAKLQEKRKLKNKLKQKHFQIIEDKGFDVEEQVNDLNEDDDYYLKQHSGTYFIKKLKRKVLKWKNRIRKSNAFIHFNSSLDKFISKIPIMKPESSAKFFWEILVAVLMIYFFIAIPLQLAFNNQLLSHTTIVFTILSCFIFMLSILLKINTAYFSMGQLETSRVQIFLHYFDEGLIWDVASVAILFIVNLNAWIVNDSKRNWLEFLMLIFFTQFRHIQILKNQIEETMYWSQNKMSIYNIIKLIFTLLLVEHFFSCLWAMIGLLEMEAKRTNWIEFRSLENSHWTEQYLNSIYFTTVTLTSVGYGDILPQSSIEKIFCIIFMIISSIQLSYSVSLVGNTLSELTEKNDKKLKKMRLINNYLRKKKINMKLKNQIREYLSFYWLEGNIKMKDEQNEIIGELSEELKTQLDYHSNVILFLSCPLIKDNFSKCVLDLLPSQVERIHLNPKAMIQLQKERTDTYIYYLEEGIIQETLTDKNIITEKAIKAGTIIGLKNFITGKVEPENYQSVGFSTLIRISRQDFLNVLDKFPQDLEKFCMIRDEYEFGGKINTVNKKCKLCNKNFHSLVYCPTLHYVADREVMVKRCTFPNEQGRTNHFKRNPYREKIFSALMDLPLVQNTIKTIKENVHNPYEQFTESEEDEEDYDGFKSIKDQLKPKKKALLPPIIGFTQQTSVSHNQQMAQNQNVHLSYKEKERFDQSQRKLKKKWEKKRQVYEQNFKEVDIQQFELLALKQYNHYNNEDINVRQNQIIYRQCDMVNEYTYYYPQDNIQNVIQQLVIRQQMIKPYSNLKHRLILYMLNPDEYRMKYLLPFEKEMQIRYQEKQKKQKVQERFKAMLKLGNSKKKKGLAMYVEQIRKKTQVTPKAN